MALYPSLEDMKVHQVQQAQDSLVRTQQTPGQERVLARRLSELGVGGDEPAANNFSTEGPWSGIYAAIMDDYMGLRLEPPSGYPTQTPQSPTSAQDSQYAVATRPEATVATPTYASVGGAGMVAPLSGMDVGLRRANVTHGVRELVLCKDSNGRVGLRLRDINKGVFVQFVETKSPASMAGLRFGDQILQVNGVNVAGFSSDKAMDLFRKAPPQRILVAVRDRPFERTITLHKDSSGHVGFTYKNGVINAIEKDSSAARNGLLTEHQMLEVNGQNVVGLKDDEIREIVAKIDQIVTVTVMPKTIYDHIIKRMADGLVKKLMDHSVPGV